MSSWQYCAGGSAESEEQYDQLADADDKAAFLRTLDRRETANLASFMRAKYADEYGRVQQEIADELEVRSLDILSRPCTSARLPADSFTPAGPFTDAVSAPPGSVVQDC